MSNIITNIEVQKRNKKRVNVYIDHEYSFSCDAEIVYKYDLKKSKVVDLNVMKEITDLDNFLKGKSDALRIVERSYKTEKEIREKLQEKGYENPIVEKIIEFLKEYSFIDDTKYAKMYISDKKKTSGKNKLKYDLLKKGVDKDVIGLINQNTDEDEEITNAVALVKKKYAVLANRENDKRKINEKLLRFLVGKGFDWEIAKKAIAKVLEIDLEE